jgi:hypothetical protein
MCRQKKSRELLSAHGFELETITSNHEQTYPLKIKKEALPCLIEYCNFHYQPLFTNLDNGIKDTNICQ